MRDLLLLVSQWGGYREGPTDLGVAVEGLQLADQVGLLAAVLALLLVRRPHL